MSSEINSIMNMKTFIYIFWWNFEKSKKILKNINLKKRTHCWLNVHMLSSKFIRLSQRCVVT